jgi:hypothetical protein
MTLLSVVKDVCATVGVLVPQSVFSNITGNRTMQEMLSLANEMAQRIAYDARDWTDLKKVATFAGDGIKTAFDMPADYKRMLLNSNVWKSSNTLVPMRFIPDTDEWLNRRTRNYYDAHGEWTIIGGQILIVPVMGTGVSAYFAYLHKNCVSLASGGFGDSFLSDNDTFVIDDRVLKLGMVWQWKAQKGSPYAEDMGTYGDALTSIMGRDSPAPIIVGRRAISASARVAYPFTVPTP